MKNIKKYDEFVNESFVDIINYATAFMVTILALFWVGVGIWGLAVIIRNLVSSGVFRQKSKKIFDIFLRYKDDPVIKPVLIEYIKLESTGGEEESDGSKEEAYSQKRLRELSKIVNDRLRELMSDKEYKDFRAYRYNIVEKLKRKFWEENPEDYRKSISYVPEWDKDTMVDKFLEDASEFFDEGYKARNWREQVRHIIDEKWIIENDNIILEEVEEEDDDDVVYLDNVTNEFIWEITRDSFQEGYHERNFREALSVMIKEKGYKISKKIKKGEQLNLDLK
jgi:hypothetical protein